MNRAVCRASGYSAAAADLEEIVVIKRELIFAQGQWHGLRTDQAMPYLALIKKQYQLQPRVSAEYDAHFKQIIPYLVCMHNNHYFVLQRTAHTTEQRLKNKLSLGVGGHLHQQDMQGDSIVDWAAREWREEVAYAGACRTSVLGLLNDERNSVGQVHLGCVVLMQLEIPHIAVRSELKCGSFMTYEQCQEEYARFEPWSQILIDYFACNRL